MATKKVTKKEPATRKVSGSQVTGFRTLGSHYDRGKLIDMTLDDGTTARIDVNEFLKIIDGASFDLKLNRVHLHAELNEDDYQEFLNQICSGDISV